MCKALVQAGVHACGQEGGRVMRRDDRAKNNPSAGAKRLRAAGSRRSVDAVRCGGCSMWIMPPATSASRAIIVFSSGVLSWFLGKWLDARWDLSSIRSRYPPEFCVALLGLLISGAILWNSHLRGLKTIKCRACGWERSIDGWPRRRRR